MPYQSTKPAAADYMSVSQGDLQGNFLALKAAIDVNHETFGSAYEGKHKMLSLPEQTVSLVAPVFPLATSATELGLYTKRASGTTHLFLRPVSQLPGIDTNDRNLTLWGNSNPGWCLLPCGMIMKWGQANLTNAGSQAVTYPVGAGIPVFAHVYSVQISTVYTDGDTIAWVVSYASTTSFNAQSKDVRTGGHNKAATITYLAIGD